MLRGAPRGTGESTRPGGTPCPSRVTDVARMCQADVVELVNVVVLGLDGRVVGAATLVVAATLLALASAWLARVNPADPLPTGWGNPPQAPAGALVMRGAGAGLAVLGVILLDAGIGWTIVLVLLVFVPYGAINVVHNTRLRRNGTSR